MWLTSSQKKSVDNLIKAFDNKKNINYASFKAPTGSGKTFMASEFISQVFARELISDKKTIFIVATISNAKLPKQFAKKLNNYKKFHDFNNYKIEYIESPSNSKNNKIEDIKEFDLEDNKVFVFGTSSFGKNTLFYQNKTLDNFLTEAKERNYQIFFIRDEAHIGKKESITKNDLKTFDEKIKNNASFILYMTATPKDRTNLIEMTSKDMENDGVFLLKTEQKKTELIGEVSNEEIIDDAIKKFIETKNKYKTIKDQIIKPALLIQVMNESDYEKDPIKNEQFHEGLGLLENKLKKAGLIYLKYLNNNPVIVGSNLPNTLDYASEIDSEIDAIIFKVGPATGWDIPRANMLLQLRNVSSESLNMQTVGRIMRNPYKNLERNNITNKYYIYSNYQNPTRNEAFYKLKNKFIDEKFISGRINTNSGEIKKSNKNYVEEVKVFIDSKEFTNKLKDLIFEKDIIYDEINYGSAYVSQKIPNHIYLKIYNKKIENKLENKLHFSLFTDKLIDVSQKKYKNLEIVKYVFFSFISKLNEIKSKNCEWVKSKEPYNLLNDVRAKKTYSIWKDNVNPKLVNTKKIENYGYIQITEDENIQFLDSTPEMEFYKRFINIISTKQLKNIKFFAKMPTLGSQVYFEYYSKINGKITKSYMDFAIKYKDKIIMIEVKSGDKEYDAKKTKELLNAYEIYMKKFNESNISLLLYKYFRDNNSHEIYGYIDGKWQNKLSFRDFFDALLK